MAHQQPQAKTSFRKQILALIGENYGDKTLCLCPTGFVRLFRGDHKAAILLSQILYWAERTSDPDGWFYKSYADWHAETGLTEAQVRRILNGDSRVQSQQITLRDIGIETKIKKVKHTGAPTLHYRVNQAKLVEALGHLVGQGEPQQCEAPTLNIAEDQSCTLSGVNPEQCGASLISSEISTLDQSARDQDQSATQDDEDSDLRLFSPFENRFGKLKPATKPLLREQLARLGVDQVQEVLQRCASRGRSWNYVCRALANEEPTSKTVSNSDNSDFQAFSYDGAQIPQKTPETPLLAVSERVLLPITDAAKPLSAQSIWEASYHQLEFQLDQGSFSAWVRGSVLVDFDPAVNRFVVAAKSVQAVEMLSQRLKRTIQRILR